MDLKERILNLAEQVFPETIDIRRHIHQHPELSFQEFSTSKYVCDKLKEWDIEYRNNIVSTGVVAYIRGNNPEKKLLALRADMDALPIKEENDVPYKSQNPGVMHACGHDVHTSSLLGTARILKELKDQFEGTVMLIFQPGEEKLPGGAKLMLEAGIFAEREPDMVIAQHVLPGMDAGYVGFKPGMYMASCDEIFVTVKGKGGHGAMPHQLNDTVLASAHLIVALQQVVSRFAEASVPSVLSIGKVIAEGATNVIPGEVYMEGTFRTMNENWRMKAHEKMTSLAKGLMEGMGCECDFRIDKGYPVLVNDEKSTLEASRLAKQFLGNEKVIDLDIRMTAEDFAYFTQRYPCTFYRLGVNKKGESSAPLHSSKFNVDEEALRTGIGLMAWLSVSFLNAKV
ncbi:MAG TPA: M20 family metallopeptidase [Bacteroidales bacterium]|nr:M20 family metallopeptidase [Bacteroidales bacterium]